MSWAPMATLLSDVKYAVRRSRASPLQSTIAIVVAAIATAFAISFFRLYENLALPTPRGFDAPSQLIGLALSNGSSTDPRFSGRLRNAIESRSHTIRTVAALVYVQQQVTVRERRMPALIGVVTDNFFSGLGVRLRMGDGARSEVPGVTGPSVVLSYRFWKRIYHADPNVLGQRVRIGGSSFVISGVADPSFTGVHLGSEGADIWAPLRGFAQKVWRGDPAVIVNRFRMVTVGRLRPGVGTSKAQVDLDSLTSRLRRDFRQDFLGMRLTLLPNLALEPIRHAKAVREVRLLLLAAICLVIVAAGNLSLFFLAHASHREREMGIRIALGATRMRLARQLFTESSLLVLVGVAAGLLLENGVTISLRRLPFLAGLTLQNAPGLSWRTALFVGMLLIVSAAVSAAVPALNVARRSVHARTRAVTTVAKRTEKATIALQLCLAAVVLSTTALFVESFLRSWGAETGYRADNLKAITVKAVAGNLPTNVDNVVILRSLVTRRLASIPGIRGVAFGRAIPTLLAPSTYSVKPSNGTRAEVATYVARVGLNWLRVLETPVLFGQPPKFGDSSNVVVNRRFADLAWGRENVVGERLRVPLNFSPDGGAGETTRELRVSAVVGDIYFGSPEESPKPLVLVYRPTVGDINASILVRGTANDQALASALKEILSHNTPALTTVNIISVARRLNGLLARDRARTILTGIAGGLTALLAVLGLFGVLRYSIDPWRMDFAVRSAMGATARSLIKHVFARTFALGAPGAVLGIAVSAAALSVVRTQFNLWRIDSLLLPLLSSALAIGILIAVVACSPARAVKRIEPAILLRND